MYSNYMFGEFKMKINRILLVSLLLLTIFTIGAVSAADNANLTDSGDNIIQAPEEDVELEDTLLSDEDYVKAEVTPRDGTYKVNDLININVEISKNTSGYIQCYIDTPGEDDEPEYFDEGGGWLSTARVPQDFGDHILYVKYFDGNRPDKTLEFPFTCKDYELNVCPDYSLEYAEGYIQFDKEADLRIYIPENAKGTLKIKVNGKEYTTSNIYEDDWWVSSITADKEDIIYGVNSVEATFTPADKNSPYKAKTIKTTFNTTGYAENPTYVGYNSKTNVTLIMPSDAKGKMTVKIDENEYTADVNGGKTQFTYPALDLGWHNVLITFDGNYYMVPYESSIQFTGNVIAPHLMWDKEDRLISIELPQTIKGNITVEEEGEEIARAALVNGKATVKLDIPIGYHVLNFYYEGEEYIELPQKDIEVITNNPSWTMDVDTDSIVRGYACLHIKEIPDWLNPNYQLIIDGEEFETTEDGNNLLFDGTKLSKGKHNYTLNFLGDGYYKETSASGSFEADDIIVIFPDEYVLADQSGEKDTVEVLLAEDATGTLTFTVNGKTFKTVDLTDEFADYYYTINAEIPKENIKFNATNTVTVKLVDKKYKTITKTAKIFGTYELSPIYQIEYGNTLTEIRAPYELDVGKITASIDGKKYGVIKDKDDYFHIKNTEKLGIGNHSVVLSYAGDKKFPALSKTSNLEVIGDIFYQTDSDNPYVLLLMPDDAKGNLKVTVNGAEYANVKAAGKANVTLSDLPWGKYELIAEYTGDDYDLKPVDDTFSIAPKFNAPSKLIVGTTDSISLNLTGINGSLNVYIGDFDKEVDLENGFASITLPVLPVGTNWVYATFYHKYINEFDNDDYDAYHKTFEIEVINPITAKDTAVVYSASGKYQSNIKDINGNPVTSGKVTFYILDGKKQILKKEVNIKNGVATLSYKITQGVKTYTIKTVYNKASVTKKLTVKHVVSLKAIKVKKSAKKVTIQANLAKVNGKYLKGKKVTFKFNGKTYKAKTNSKGIAKVTIKSNILKKLKVGKKITYQATYQKDTVKKTVKVQR